MRPRRLHRSAVVAALAALALAAVPQTSLGMARAPAPSPDAGTGAARVALLQARALLAPGSGRGLATAAAGPRDATMVLRDLLANLRGLSGPEHREALGLLARPDDNSGGYLDYTVPQAQVSVECSEHFCVHWVASTVDAPSPEDIDGDSIPDYITTVLTTLEQVWETEIDTLGFRAPKPDLTSTNHGPDGRVDVYLGDVGRKRLYGYCTSDDPVAAQGESPISAYCVLDNDFAAAQFATYGTYGVEALEVTAAHEFFHAVQAAYDFYEDRTFMEGTATWVEDVVFDDVNDNRQFLKKSQLVRPDISFDRNTGQEASGFQYGAWILFRFLTERYGLGVVRRAWEFADATPGGPDQYSLEALDSALSELQTAFRTAYRDFTVANESVAASYEEGADYPQPPLSRSAKVRRGATVSGTVELDHLTSWYGRFRPGRGVGADGRLQLSFQVPPPARGPFLTVLVERSDGKVRTAYVRIGAGGKGSVTVRFGTGRVKSVKVVMTNASDTFRCFVGSSLTCAGSAQDDGLSFSYRARVR